MKIVQSQTKRFAVLTRTWVRAFGGKWLVQPTRCLRRARQLLNQWNNYINETIISFLCHCHISNTNLQKKRDVWAVRMNGFHPKTWFLYKSVGQRNVRATRFCSHQNTNLVKSFETNGWKEGDKYLYRNECWFKATSGIYRVKTFMFIELFIWCKNAQYSRLVLLGNCCSKPMIMKWKNILYIKLRTIENI